VRSKTSCLTDCSPHHGGLISAKLAKFTLNKSLILGSESMKSRIHDRPEAIDLYSLNIFQIFNSFSFYMFDSFLGCIVDCLITGPYICPLLIIRFQTFPRNFCLVFDQRPALELALPPFQPPIWPRERHRTRENPASPLARSPFCPPESRSRPPKRPHFSRASPHFPYQILPISRIVPARFRYLPVHIWATLGSNHPSSVTSSYIFMP